MKTNNRRTVDTPEKMCIGRQRRCDMCNRTYTWQWNMFPIHVYNLMLEDEKQGRKLVCSWLCYFKLVGRFTKKIPLEMVHRLNRLSQYLRKYPPNLQKGIKLGMGMKNMGPLMTMIDQEYR